MEEKIIEKKTVKRNRPITYSFRVSERERRIIDEKVKTSGLSRTDFLIRTLTDKAIRGQKLGDNYTKREVLSVIEKHGNRTGGYAVGAVAENQRDTEGGNGERTIERGVGDLKREMQRLNQQAEYAHRGLDYERERDKERQQLLREKAERERAERSQRDTRDNAGRTEVQSGSKSNYKERDWSNSR